MDGLIIFQFNGGMMSYGGVSIKSHNSNDQSECIKPPYVTHSLKIQNTPTPLKSQVSFE